MTTSSSVDQLCIDTLRFLSADMIEQAKSGHPGLPMGAATFAYRLWTRFLRHNPCNPQWFNRDRFVLSAGHGSALLYSLLHLTGYDLPLEQLRLFRQKGSRTPGHPERGVAPGVEATTGPLGQGVAMAVGMAMAEAHLAARFNRPGLPVIHHFTYCLAGDGDLMEGVAAESASLAGHLRLGKLICLYDDNRISLAGATDLAFTEDRAARFAACGWQVLTVADGNDPSAVDRAIAAAQTETGRPSLLLIRTRIGWGAPTRENSFEVHGSPLGRDELRKAKQNRGWPPDDDFHIPREALERFRESIPRGTALEEQWQRLLDEYRFAYPEEAEELRRRMAGELPGGWDADLPDFPPDPKGMATRTAGGKVMNRLKLPELFGGSADLNPSTQTVLAGAGDFQSPDFSPGDSQGATGGAWGYEGRNVHFGVREHAMGGAVNGIALHGGLIPFAATFFTFSDYLRPALRLAALMELGVIHVFTHDSIALGEDGPTHQPVEHLAALRAIPGLVVIRPADSQETAEAWRIAVESRHRPVALVLSRQNIPVADRSTCAPATGVRQGGYVLADADGGSPELILIATGSEVALALEARAVLQSEGIRVRVVSLPSWELFDAQPGAYRDRVLPPEVTARLAIEAGSPMGWCRYAGSGGEILGVDRFGISAPAGKILEEFGFTVEEVCRRARHLARGNRAGNLRT